MTFQQLIMMIELPVNEPPSYRETPLSITRSPLSRIFFFPRV